MNWSSQVIAFQSDDQQQVFAQGLALGSLFGVVPMWERVEGSHGLTSKPRRHGARWWTVVHLPTERMMAHLPGESFACGFCEALTEHAEGWRFAAWQGTDAEKQALCEQWDAAAQMFCAYDRE
jgi:hypothetical protein